MSSQLPSQPLQELSFSICGFISRCPEQVYEAIVDPRQLSRYFATGGAQGRMETGATVTWDFADCPGQFPVQVLEVSPSRKVVFEWSGTDTMSDKGMTRVSFTLEPVDDYTRTKVTIIYTAVALVVLLALPSLLPVDLPEGLLTRFVG